MRSPYENPLDPVTRAERRLLVGSAGAAIFIQKTGLIPTQISTLGIVFSEADRAAVSWGLAIIVTYFCVSFLVFAATDFMRFKMSLAAAEQHGMRSAVVPKSRAYLEFVIPPAIAVVALGVLLAKW